MATYSRKYVKCRTIRLYTDYKEYFETNAPSRIRRAVCMQAIGYVRIYVAREKLVQQGKIDESENMETTNINGGIYFYKELYKILDDKKIQIKLYNGKTWKWYESRLSKPIPKESEFSCIKAYIKNSFVMISIPERYHPGELKTIEERMKNKNIRVCGVVFSGRNNIATCVILDKKGKLVKTLFIKGGDEYKYLICKNIKQIRRSNIKGNYSKSYIENHNKKYWSKIGNINKYYSGMVSKRIVDFCVENKAEVIAIPNAQCDKDILTYNKKFNSMNLRPRIAERTKEKCIQQNILRTFIDMKRKTDLCYKCNEQLERTIIKKSRKVIKEEKAICENGHQIDYFFNFAMNTALHCYKKYGIKIKV